MSGGRARSPVRIAAVDIGTNSIHLVAASVSPSGFTVLASEKEVVRLGGGGAGLDVLTAEAMERGVNAVLRMRRIADSLDAEIRLVATSAVREAENQSDFVAMVRQSTGLDVEILSGVEEAHLIHLGVSHALDLARESVLTVDIGGGSTEFCLARRGSIRLAQSVKLGAVRMTDAHLPEGVVTDTGLRRLKARIRSAVSPIAHDVTRHRFDRVVLSSGTAETLARMAIAARGGGVPSTLNGQVFTRSELSHVVGELLQRPTPGDRSELAGLEPKRADIIVAGALILDEIARSMSISEFTYCDYALREGVLIDTAQRRGILEAEPEDPARTSAIRLAERCSVDLDHATHVGLLAQQIVKGLSRFYEIDDSVSRLAEIAGILARVGTAVSYSRYHLHSGYMIRNADLMALTDEEIETVSLSVRYHRKGGPKPNHEEFARLSEARRHDVELIAGVLRVASGLDRSRDRAVESVAVSMSGGRVVLTLRTRPDSDDSLDLDVDTAEGRRGPLSEFLEADILIRR